MVGVRNVAGSAWLGGIGGSGSIEATEQGSCGKSSGRKDLREGIRVKRTRHGAVSWGLS